MSFLDDDGMSDYISADLNDELKGGLLKVHSNEEIEKFTVNEDLPESERALQFLNDGFGVQILSVINNLPRIYKQGATDANEKVLQAVLQSIQNYESELQIALAHSLATIIRDKLVPQSSLTDAVLPTITLMLDRRDPDVLDAWLSTLFEAMAQLPKRVLKQQVVKAALSKGEMSESVSCRVICCQILGKLASLLDADGIEETFFTKAMALCQDTDYEVRICMCQQLNWIARGIGLELTQRVLLSELMELLRDEEVEVREAAFLAIVALLDFLDKQTKKEQIIPLFRQYCTQPPEDMARVILSSIGDFLNKIGGDLETEDDGLCFFEFYKTIGQRSDVEFRRLCAYNLPGVLKAVGSRRYALHLHQTLVNLAQDSSPVVRKTVAAGLHEVGNILGKERVVKYLKEPFIRLLQDESVEVQDALLENLETLLSLFAVSNEDQRRTAYSEILPAMLYTESGFGNSWRRQLRFLSQCDKFVSFYSCEQLYDNIFPLLFKYMASGTIPVRAASTKAACILIRKNKTRAQRHELLQRLIREFAKGRSYWLRMVFITLCLDFLTYFSRRFFKETLLEAALELSQDSVANVRMKFCVLLPLIKTLIKLPEDAALLQRIKDIVAKLRTDPDADVAAAAAVADDRMCKIPVRNSSISKETPEELLDQQKMAEEDLLLQQEETEGANNKNRPDYRRTYGYGYPNDKTSLSPNLCAAAPPIAKQPLALVKDRPSTDIKPQLKPRPLPADVDSLKSAPATSLRTLTKVRPAAQPSTPQGTSSVPASFSSALPSSKPPQPQSSKPRDPSPAIVRMSRNGPDAKILPVFTSPRAPGSVGVAVPKSAPSGGRSHADKPSGPSLSRGSNTSSPVGSTSTTPPLTSLPLPRSAPSTQSSSPLRMPLPSGGVRVSSGLPTTASSTPPRVIPQTRSSLTSLPSSSSSAPKPPFKK